MSILTNIFGKKEAPIQSYADFWAWFESHEKDFYKVVKRGSDIEKGFFDKLTPKLEELKPGYFFLTGMFDDNTAELVLTADSNTKNIVFVEELVQAAPKIDGWKITSLKPPMDIKDVSIRMSGFEFGEENISFFANEVPAYPDEIDITVVHHDLNEENNAAIRNGTYIFLDNYLGELDFASSIDNLTIEGKEDVNKELVPIGKLKDFLIWRQKEFVEKYEGVRYNTANDEYAIFEAELESGNKLIAMMNTKLLKWDSKASHPWMALIILRYDGSQTNGMPTNEDSDLLNKIEEEIMQELKDYEGNLNVGRQTANGERAIYFACKDFRKPSKVLYQVQKSYGGNFEIEYDIYKDKYWRTLERFNPISV